MEISKEARTRLDNRVSRIVSDIDVYESDKQEIIRELTSHFYDSSMTRAQTRGSSCIEKEDVDAILAESEDPAAIAAEYMKSFVNSLDRAGVVSRTIAFVVDLLTMLIAVFAVLLLLTLPLLPFFPGSIVINTTGNHDSTMSAVSFTSALSSAIFTILWSMGILATIVIYFVVLEGRFGFTPGKWLLGLRVLKDDGTRINYVDSLLRNLPKLLGSSSLLALDALLMVILFRKDQQRGFDKIARTIVVHKDKKSGGAHPHIG
ncbi:MAG TPA: RDD family protein [Methanocella sp.]|nr:RDD family protein [Methanocella sp.]